MKSIEARLVEVKYRPSGFDYLRLLLAISVVCFHSVITSYGPLGDAEMWGAALGPLVRLILPMFFALSGFLVAGSLFRSDSVGQFLWLRAIRIYPALVVEVLLSAFILGPLLSSMPPSAYFSNSLFYQYLWNVVGHIHFQLPGLFRSNPLPFIVNAQLWTVPFELYCYITIAILTVLGIRTSKHVSILAALGLALAYLLLRLWAHGGEFPAIAGGVPGILLVDAFLFGVAAYIYRDRLPWSAPLFVLASILAVGAASSFHFGVLLLPALSAYCTVYIGLLNPKAFFAIRGADYSYGIFLYGFVIQQAFMAIFPELRVWWLNILVSLPVAIAFAALSWHCVEKPSLRLRRIKFTGATSMWPMNLLGTTKK